MIKYFIDVILPKLQCLFVPILLVALVVFPLINWLDINETIAVYSFWVYLSLLFFGCFYDLNKEIHRRTDLFLKTLIDNSID